jgi:hypothetical protein
LGIGELVLALLDEEESATLDFKSEQYKFALASDDRTDAVIYLGAKEVKGGRSVVTGVNEHIDDAALQSSSTPRRTDRSRSRTRLRSRMGRRWR